MTGQLVGYIRVSSFDQNPARQLEGIKLDRRYIDKISGGTIDRPQLQEMLDYVREGDSVIVHSMDRLARNMLDLRKLVTDLNDKGIKVKFVKEGLDFTGDDSPTSNLILSIIGSIAEFEKSLIRERQREGIALAKKKGKYKGRKPALTEEQILQLQEQIGQGLKKVEVAKHFGISYPTLCKYLKQEIILEKQANIGPLDPEIES